MSLEDKPGTSRVLADMELDALRAYRKDLQSEEDKVSYWRRLVHARLDLIEAGSSTSGSLTLPQLIRVLGDTGTGASRQALSTIHASDPLPDLPESEWMWVSEIDYHDPEAVTEATARLRAAEEKLTEYRKALFERLDAATAELIVRYRENPTAALTILPLAD
ncbi:MAG: RsiG family protein [Sporichthyaceae bacterium]